jgi:hypothetical protein
MHSRLPGNAYEGQRFLDQIAVSPYSVFSGRCTAGARKMKEPAAHSRGPKAWMGTFNESKSGEMLLFILIAQGYAHPKKTDHSLRPLTCRQGK